MASKAVTTAIPKSNGKRLVLFGASGFVGSAIGRIAHSRGWSILACCRSGAPIVNEPWAVAESTQWVAIDANQRTEVYNFLSDFSDSNTTAVINSIGMLTMNHTMARRFNGDNTLNIAAALYEKKAPNVNSVVMLSASRNLLAQKLFHGYYYGKLQGEKALKEYLPASTKYTILRPGMIYGTRVVKNGISVPLTPVFGPIGLVMWPFAACVPQLCPAPPIHVDTVAKAALFACEEGATDVHYPSATLEYNEINQYAKRL